MKLEQIKIYLFQLGEFVLGKRILLSYYSKFCVSLFKKNEVIFIHIPKNGGTSVSYSLFGRRAGHNYAATVLDVMGRLEYDRLFSFSIARNPFERLVSAYHYAIQGGGTDGGVRKRPIYQSAIFQSFASFVKNWLVLQNPESIDIIFRPQYLFIFDSNMNQLVKWVGKIENSKEIELVLFKELGRRIQIERKNKSVREDFQSYYTDELRLLVVDFYRKDFELLLYSKYFE